MSKASTTRLIDLLREVLHSASRESEAAHKALMREAIDDTEGAREKLFEYWWSNNYRTLRVTIGKNSTVVTGRERVRRDVKTRAAAIASKLRNRILLDYVLPNGVALRDATGAMGVRAGGWIALVAKQVKPTQVIGKHLTEEQVQNLALRIGLD